MHTIIIDNGDFSSVLCYGHVSYSCTLQSAKESLILFYHPIIDNGHSDCCGRLPRLEVDRDGSSPGDRSVVSRSYERAIGSYLAGVTYMGYRLMRGYKTGLVFKNSCPTPLVDLFQSSILWFLWKGLDVP